MVAAAKADISTLLRHIMLSSKGSAEHLRRRKKSEAVLTTILNANSDLSGWRDLVLTDQPPTDRRL